MLQDLELPPLQEGRHNIRLAYYYKVVEGLVPATPPQNYMTARIRGRNIRAKQYTDFDTTNIVDRSACINNRGYIVPPSKAEQYRNSLFARTTIDLNHLSDQTVTLSRGLNHPSIRATNSIRAISPAAIREKGRDLTQSYDKSPYTNRNVKREK